MAHLGIQACSSVAAKLSFRSKTIFKIKAWHNHSDKFSRFRLEIHNHTLYLSNTGRLTILGRRTTKYQRQRQRQLTSEYQSNIKLQGPPRLYRCLYQEPEGENQGRCLQTKQHTLMRVKDLGDDLVQQAKVQIMMLASAKEVKDIVCRVTRQPLKRQEQADVDCRQGSSHKYLLELPDMYTILPICFRYQ